jgi:hypothetical protein
MNQEQKDFWIPVLMWIGMIAIIAVILTLDAILVA